MTFSLCSTVLYIRTPDYSSNWSSYLAPFKWQLWRAIVTSTFLLAIGLRIVCRFGTVQGNKQSQRHSFLEALHCVFASLCWQGKKLMQHWTGFNASINLFLHTHVITSLFMQWKWYRSSDFVHTSMCRIILNICLHVRRKFAMKYLRKIKNFLPAPYIQV